MESPRGGKRTSTTGSVSVWPRVWSKLLPDMRYKNKQNKTRS